MLIMDHELQQGKERTEDNRDKKLLQAAESRIRGPMESKTGRELAGETEVVVRGKLLNTEINGGGVVWAMTRSIGQPQELVAEAGQNKNHWRRGLKDLRLQKRLPMGILNSLQ